jgi:tetratricopeptide (TPR) repeat protein
MADRQFRGHFKIILFLAIAFWLFSGGAAGACQGGQEKEESAERLLLQADQFLSQKEYSKAIGCYLEAAGIAQKKINLSRAYFGLSRAYFYLEDIDSASRWMHKVLDVDPHKEISPFFHPPSFVELFNEARKEASAAQKKEAKELILPKKPPEPEVRREEAQKETPVKPKEAPPPVKKVSPPRQEVPAPEKISTAQKWEVEAHYGSWTAGPVKNGERNSWQRRWATSFAGK